MDIVLAVVRWAGLVLAVILGVLVTVVAIIPPLVRPFTNRWGATDAEVAASFPGDAYVKAPQQLSTRAVTVKAPAELVYALVRQMGYGRGGWYAWDWFYRRTGSADFVDGHHSKRIDPTLQQFGLGDSMYLFPGAGLEVVIAEPPEALVMYKRTDDATGEMVAADATPEKWSDMTWAWIVRRQDDGTTRLILRTSASSAGRSGFEDWLWNSPLEAGGAVFAFKTLVGLKRTAEKLHTSGVEVDVSGRQIAGPTQ